MKEELSTQEECTVQSLNCINWVFIYIGKNTPTVFQIINFFNNCNTLYDMSSYIADQPVQLARQAGYCCCFWCWSHKKIGSIQQVKLKSHLPQFLFSSQPWLVCGMLMSCLFAGTVKPHYKNCMTCQASKLRVIRSPMQLTFSPW